jgi:hypothetical protein
MKENEIKRDDKGRTHEEKNQNEERNRKEKN